MVPGSPRGSRRRAPAPRHRGGGIGTPQVLAQYVRNWGADRLDVRIGPGKGFVANFLSLACDTAIKADYYGFCDQDDLWDADKLERALAWLDAAPRGMPALYCARTRLIAEDGGDIGFSPFFGKPLTFRNALVQSIAGGNTTWFGGPPDWISTIQTTSGQSRCETVT